MRIAVLSGKGGTGKTMVATNLAAAAREVVLLDCDVEEPNAELFLRPEALVREAVQVPVPRVDPKRCDGCRVCVDFCRYHALAWAGGRLRIFDEICHQCGGCVLLCPLQALREEDRRIGEIRRGRSGMVDLRSGMLDPGEVSGIPLIERLWQGAPTDGSLVIADCPPGASCGAMACIRPADRCVLVAEDTRFGLDNLIMVRELTALLGKPAVLVINKWTGGGPVETYCREENIPVAVRIPFDRGLQAWGAQGRIASRESERWRDLFGGLLRELERQGMGHGAAAGA